MRSKGFTAGFLKTAGVLDSVLAPVKAVAKLGLKAAGGPLNAGLTGLGALSEGAQSFKKMTDAATRG